MTFKEFIDELKFRYNGQIVKIEDYDCEKVAVNDDFKKNFEELRDECNLELTNEELTDKKGVVHNVDDVTVSYTIVTMDKKLVLFIYVCNKNERNVIGEYEPCVYQEDVVYRPDTWEDFANIVSNVYKHDEYDIANYRYIGKPINSLKSEYYQYKLNKTVNSSYPYELTFKVIDDEKVVYIKEILISQVSKKALRKMYSANVLKGFVTLSLLIVGVFVIAGLIALSINYK